MSRDAHIQNKLSEILAALNPQVATQTAQTPAAAAAAPLPPTRPDVRTVTTLPAAHRYITQHLLRDASVAPAIRALRAWQHSKERYCFQERQVLLRRHSERAATEARLSALMGTKVAPPALSAQQELAEFDRAVWNNSKAVAQQIEKELARIGVPLFCEDVDYGDPVRLREWRGRLVELLEDLCEDDVQ